MVSGIAHYGNCFGIPTIAGEVYFDKSYEGNPLVNAFCLGVLRHDHEIATQRGQSLAQMALAWVLRGGRVTSVLVGASKASQLDDNVAMLSNLAFSPDELSRIEAILK